MYAKGDIEIDRDEPGCQPTYDARNDAGTPCPRAKLPHSCDSWVIGGPDAVRVMIADLQAALREMEA